MFGIRPHPLFNTEPIEVSIVSDAHNMLVPSRANNCCPSIDYYEWATFRFHIYCVVLFMEGLCQYVLMKSMVICRFWQGVVLQGTFCIEKCMGGMGVVVSNEWSLNKSGRMSKFDCISQYMMVYLHWKMSMFVFNVIVIIKPDNCKVKVIPSVAEYISALKERMYKPIF